MHMLLPLCTLLIAGACGPAGSPAARRAASAERGAGPIVVGVAWPWASRKEVRYAEGLDMAVDEINAAGGVLGRRIALRKEDDHESVDEGEMVAQRLANDPDVVAVIGHLQSYVSVPASAIYDLSGLLMIAPTATDPELTARGYSRVFRATFTDTEVGRQMAEYAARQGYERIGIYYIRTDYGRNLANAFEERANDLGLTIPVRQSYEPGDAEASESFRPVLRGWVELGLDAVFLAGEVPSAARAIVAAREEGLSVPIIGGDAMSSGELISVAGEAAEGTVVATAFHADEPRAEVQRFTAAFEQRYGVAPDAGSALGYDVIRLLTDAMKRAGTALPDSVARALHSLRDWRGVTGSFTFDSTGNLVGRPIAKMAVRNGAFEYLPDSGASTTIAARAASVPTVPQ
ncbi:MAG TPA: ABC transporter substrate-binding protein [Gemmatimonadaceae bacterium]|nr:ABC transporter substrate-binding protein [Gemmatimonadaceae bacterium]